MYARKAAVFKNHREDVASTTGRGKRGRLGHSRLTMRSGEPLPRKWTGRTKDDGKMGLTMQMEFVIVYPPSSERAAEFPVGGLFLADALEKRGYGCRIICDMRMEEIFAELDAKVHENTVAIGLSIVSTLIFSDTIRLSHYIKNKYPNIPLVLGGQSVVGQKGANSRV